MYAFATMVTVFAQISAAMPLLVGAADRVPAEVGAGLKMTVESKNDTTYVIAVSGKEPANGESFDVKIKAADVKNPGFSLNPTGTNILNGAESSTVISGWVVTQIDETTLRVTREDDYVPPDYHGTGHINALTRWPVRLRFNVLAGSGSISIDGNDQPPITHGDVNTLKLGVYNNGPTTYTTGQTVNLQVGDENMTSGGEVDVVSADLSKYLKFDHDQTVTQLQKMGYSSTTVDTKEVQTLAPDAASSKVEKFAKADGTYFYLIDNNGDARVAWPAGDGKTPRIAGIAMVAIGAMATTTLTPKYLSGSLKDAEGEGVALTITQPKTPTPVMVDGTKLRFEAHSVTEVKYGDNFGIYRLSTFPLFYMKETDPAGTQLYAFVFNSPAAQTGTNFQTLRKSVAIDHKPYSEGWGGAESTTNTGPAEFENFHAVAPDGTVVAGSERQFEVGKTYTLIPDNPVPGTKDRFMRIQTKWDSRNYYMPDGVPTFSLDASGNFKLQTQADGRAIKGQWYTTGNSLQARLYRIKSVQVVDDLDGSPVSGAALKMKNTSNASGAYMKATTGDDGRGELLPDDYDNAKKGPFYYADGNQAFDSLTFAKAGYTADLNFDLKMDTAKDVLALANQKNAKISTDGQTLILTVHKITDADTKLNLQKVAQADPTKTLPDAKFRLEDVTKGTTPLDPQTATTGSDGKTQLTIDTGKVAKRVFHVTETTAPAGYDIGRAEGYYATWEAGKGFTAVGEADTATATTSTDKLASVKDGLLTIQDPTTKVVPKAAVTLKKVSASNPNKPLPGATFSFQEGEDGAATEVTSDKAGMVTYMATDDGKLHIFKITETQAPSGFLKAAAPYYVQWQNGKIMSYGKSVSDTRLQDPGYMGATLDETAGILTVQDKALASTLTTRVAQKTGSPVATGGITMFLSNPQANGSGTQQKLTTGADGTVEVTGQQVADALGLTAGQMTGTVDVHLSVANGDYTAPIARDVTYTFAGGSAAAGFAAKANGDNLVLDHQLASSVPAGNLDVILRKDTLSARAITDKNEDAGFVPGAQFKMNFIIDNQMLETPVQTIPASGILTLKDPGTLLGPDAKIVLDKQYLVILSLVSAPDKYTLVNPANTLTMQYSSGTGYIGITGTPSDTADNGKTMTNSLNGLPSSQVTTYKTAGSDITYYLLKQTNSLAFSNLPANNELNLNFGNREIQPINQDIALDAANDRSPFDNEVHPTTTLADNPNQVGIGVTQQGKYANGWRVDLETDALTSEDDSDTIDDASLTFANGQGMVDQQPKTGLVGANPLTVALRKQATTTMLSVDGQTAGQYALAWNLGNVKMHVPGGQGLPDAHYRADMTWNLIVGEP